MCEGYGGLFQYVKELWVVMLLLFLARRKPRFLYITWSLLFLCLMLDDCLQVHEKWGHFLARYVNFRPPFGLRAQDLGELAVCISYGVPLVASVWVTGRRSGTAARKISKHLLVMIGLLTFFGLGIDMVHIMVEHSLLSPMSPILGVVEDGGEMIVMSLISWYVFRLVLRAKETRNFC